jgi:hypothetical protein
MYARSPNIGRSGVDDSQNTEIDLRDGPTEIDLAGRLRFAAGSLAADFGDRLPVDLAEALVFSSAQGLLVSASVTEFVPILAERRARQAFRAAVPVPRPEAPAPRPEAPVPQPTVPTPRPDVPSSSVAPVLAVPETQLTRLRDDVEQARLRVARWRAGLGPSRPGS